MNESNPPIKFSRSGWFFCVLRKIFSLGKRGHNFSNVVDVQTDPVWRDVVAYDPFKRRNYVVQRQEMRGYQYCESCGKVLPVTGYNQRPHPLRPTELDANLTAQRRVDFRNDSVNESSADIRKKTR